MITKEEIRGLLKRLDGETADSLESETIEFKSWEPETESFHRILRESVVCFANSRGGTIVFGIKDRARTRREAIQGVGRYDIGAIRRSVYDGTDPHILVEVEELKEPEGILLLVHVPKGMPPHTTSDGVAKIRIGKECKPLTGRTFAQLISRGGQIDPTAEVVAEADERLLDPDEVQRLRRTIETAAGDLPLAKLEIRPLLESLGLQRKEGLTLAAILLVGNSDEIRRLAPQNEITFLRFRSPTRYDQRQDLRRPLLASLDALERWISVNNRVQAVQDRGFRQLELPDLSWEVAREAVLNAVTHRDYFLRQAIQVALHKDELIVDSPGGFPGDISPENVLRHPPVHRNELLARTFQAIGLVNRVGLGVDRIYEGLLRLGKELPKYEADESHVRVILPLSSNKEFVLFLNEVQRRGGQLDLDDLILLKKLSSSAGLDRWSAAAALQLSEEESALRLAHLRADGYLTVRGRGRSASYDLKRDLALRLRGRADIEGIRLDEEGLKLRILALLKERGRLTNAEIRRLSGFGRGQVYRLVKAMRDAGEIDYRGRGRGAHIIVRDKS